MTHNNFYLKVADALAGCQLVEQELKLYIATAHAAIRRNLPERIPYNFTAEDCNSDALGPLIGKLKKLSNDSSLIAELTKFKDERNFLSHRAIASCINPDGDLDIPPDLQERLEEIRITADVLWRRVYEATVLLEFDPVAGDEG